MSNSSFKTFIVALAMHWGAFDGKGVHCLITPTAHLSFDVRAEARPSDGVDFDFAINADLACSVIMNFPIARSQIVEMYNLYEKGILLHIGPHDIVRFRVVIGQAMNVVDINGTAHAL